MSPLDPHPEINTNKPKVALLTGANGITGTYMLKQLACEPHWSLILATSRRPPQSLPKDSRIRFFQSDLKASSPSSIVDSLLNSQVADAIQSVTHYFHLAYLHSDSLDEQYILNVPFFQNVLAAVVQLASNTLERVILQTGAKHYGGSIRAPAREPITEDLPRVILPNGPKNFYYDQEDFMWELQKQCGMKWSWTVTRPFLINGFTAGSGMSFATSAALYFTIQKYLNQKAIFPCPLGRESCYNKRRDVSSALHIAAFTTYLAVHPAAANEAYNIVDNDASKPTFRDIWEDIGLYFGVEVTAEEGYDLEGDVSRKLERGVWKEIVGKYGGDEEACEKYATWNFFYWCMNNPSWGANVSMNKAKREIEWEGRCDSRAELRKIFDTMREENIIPKDI